MKIIDVQTKLLTVPIERIRWSGGEAVWVPATLIQVFTGEGISGLGDVYCGVLAPEVVAALVEHFKPQLIGQDPLSVEQLMRGVYGRSLAWARSGIAVAALSGIEIACWDIAGKAAGLPVYRLLGGPVHDHLPVYASGGLDRPPDDLAAELDAYKQEGFRAVKIRIGHGATQDAERVRFAREILGDGVKLMVDAVMGHHPDPWTTAEAVQVARTIEEYEVGWFEEPCAATDVEGYREVRRATRIPIAGGESLTSLHEFHPLIAGGALDIVQPDVSHCGGLVGCRRIAALAEAHGVEVALHSWGSGAVLAATYHFAFSMPNCRILEYPTFDYPLRDELLVEPFDIRGGRLYPPKAPGLGIELRPEIVQKYPYQPGLGPRMRKAV